jgi:cyclic lactone autoinducer peptide
MKKFIASLVLFLVSLLAFAATAGACMWFLYQPEMPQKPQE